MSKINVNSFLSDQQASGLTEIMPCELKEYLTGPRDAPKSKTNQELKINLVRKDDVIAAKSPRAATLRYCVYQVEDPRDQNKKKMVMKLEDIKYNSKMFDGQLPRAASNLQRQQLQMSNSLDHLKPYDDVSNNFFKSFESRY